MQPYMVVSSLRILRIEITCQGSKFAFETNVTLNCSCSKCVFKLLCRTTARLL